MALQKTRSDEETDLSYRSMYPVSLKVHQTRIDPGTEFHGKFRKTLIERDILVTQTLPRVKTHNATEERWHRTLEEDTRAVLIRAGAPTRLWGHAVSEVPPGGDHACSWGEGCRLA